MTSYISGLGYALGADLLTEPYLNTDWTINYVDSVNGSDVTGTGTRHNPYATFAAAYAATGADFYIYVLADGHTESIGTPIDIVNDIVILGAGTSQGIPTATFSDTAGTGLMHLSASNFVMRNVKLKGYLGSSPILDVKYNSWVDLLVSIRDCYFECPDGCDYAIELVDGDVSVVLLSENNVFINTGTSATNPPNGAMKAGACVSRLLSRGDVFDGGSYGWELDTVSLTSAPAFALVLIENASLLHGSVIGEDTGANVILGVGASSVAGSARIA